VDGTTRNRFAYLGNGFTKREQVNGTIGEVQTLGFDEYWDMFNLPDVYDTERGGDPDYVAPKKMMDRPAATS
jgi:hypothetical protein